jgi:hypothetical protein
MFFALMVDALRSLAPPPRAPAVDIFCIDGGRSRIFGTASQGPTVDIFRVDGGCSRISGIASQGAYHQCFLR